MPKRRCKVSEDYFQEFPSMKKGRTNEEVLCQICNCFINIGHKGRKDILEHNDTSKHKKNLRSQSGSSGMQNFVIVTKNEDKSVWAAEATLAYHTVEHHHSFNSMDCTAKVGNCLKDELKMFKYFYFCVCFRLTKKYIMILK